MMRALLLLAISLASPAFAVDPPHPAMRSNGFDLLEAFSVPTSGRGRSRAVNGVQHWDVTTRPGRAANGAFRMREVLAYDEGGDRLQDWTIRPAEDGRYIATRPDLKGPATFRPAGPGRLKYRWTQYADASGTGGTITLRGELELEPGGRIVNRATAWKYALPLGRVHVVFHPEG